MHRSRHSRSLSFAPSRTEPDHAEAVLPQEVREIPMGLRRGAAWTWRILVVAAGVYILSKALAPVSTLVISVLVAVLLASMLTPIVGLLTKHTFLPRAAAAAIALIGLIVIVVGMFILAGRQLLDSWEGIYTAAADGFNKLLHDVTTAFNIDLQSWAELQKEGLQQLEKNASTIMNGASSAASILGNLGTGLLVTLFTLFFLLNGGAGIWRWFLGLVPEHARSTTHEAFRRGWKALGAYCRTQVLVAAVDATGIALGMVGIDLVNGMMGNGGAAPLSPYAVPVWLIVFLSSFVPLVGAFVAGAITVLLVFVLQGWIAALVMLGIVVAVQQLESNVLQPIIMGKAVELHPLAVFLGVAAGASIAGIPGALFSIPALAFCNALYCYLDGRDPAPELGEDAKVRAYFAEREKARQEFFARKQDSH